MPKKKAVISEIIALCCVAVVIWIATKALFHDGFFRTVDDVTPTRLDAMVWELQHTSTYTFPVRWTHTLANGYGYPLFIFYAPLVYYVGAIFMLVTHASNIVATKFLFFVPLAIGPLALYVMARQKYDIWTSVFGATVFGLLPYRGWDIYVRGGVATSWAIAFIPFVWLGLWTPKKYIRMGFFVSAISLALVTLSHHVVGFLLVGFLIIQSIINASLRKRIYAIIIVGTGISATFIIPCIWYLAEIRYTHTAYGSTSLMQNLLPLKSFFTDRSQELVHNQISIPSLILLVFSGFYALLRRPIQWRYIVLVSVAYAIFFAQFDISAPLWHLLYPIARLLQYPMRLLALWSFVLPLIALHTYHMARQRNIKILLICLVSVGIYINLSFFRPLEYSTFYEYTPSPPCMTTTWEDEYLPKGVQECQSGVPSTRFELIQKDINNLQTTTPLVTKRNDLVLSTKYNHSTKTTLISSVYWFPGWVLMHNNDQSDTYPYGKHGLVASSMDPGNYTVSLRYRNTSVMRSADLISILTILALICWVFHINIKRISVSILVVGIIGATYINYAPHSYKLLRNFTPKQLEARYNASQYVVPGSKHPINDAGIHAYAAWRTVTGDDPTIISAEHPPLAKYIIGFGYVITRYWNTSSIVAGIMLMGIITYITYRSKGTLPALVVSFLLVTDTNLRDQIVDGPVLDIYQVLFLVASIYAWNRQSYRFTWLLVGAMAASKMWFPALLLTGTFIVATPQNEKKQLFTHLVFAPFMYLASYTLFFLQHHSLLDFVRVQLWMWHYWADNAVNDTIVFASIVPMILVNRWPVGGIWVPYAYWTPLWPLTWVVGMCTACIRCWSTAIKHCFSLSASGHTHNLTNLYKIVYTCINPTYTHLSDRLMYVLSVWVLVATAYSLILPIAPRYLLLIFVPTYILLCQYDWYACVYVPIRNYISQITIATIL